MIVDFQHHFTPRELIKDDPGERLVLHYDALGAPSYTVHSLLYDLDEHVRMMELAGIDFDDRLPIDLQELPILCGQVLV